MRNYTDFLQCAGCGKVLTGEEFTVIADKNYCETCATPEVTPEVTPVEIPAV